MILRYNEPSAVIQASGGIVNRNLAVRYVIREISGIVGMGVALFWSAGTFAWWPAWAALGVMVAWIAATAVVVLRLNPDLLAERLGPRQGAKRWDAAIVSILGLVQLVRYIVAGLDRRHGWTGGNPMIAQMVALVTCILGYALFTWATAANRFFSQIMRVQTERGHAVVSGGPYRWVRHPAYLGAILHELAVPVLLASWWSGIAGATAAGLLLLRTVLEDRALQVELSGYAEYACRVRYRLVPGVW